MPKIEANKGLKLFRSVIEFRAMIKTMADVQSNIFNSIDMKNLSNEEFNTLMTNSINSFVDDYNKILRAGNPIIEELNGINNGR